MKKIFAPCLLLILISSCKDKVSKLEMDKDKVEDNLILQKEEVIDKLPNNSDISFIAAIEEYQAGNYEKASEYIENGVISLRQEEKAPEKIEGILLLDDNIKTLRSLAEKVRTNKIEDIHMLTQAMANAEMLIAHDYIVYTVSTLLEEPVKGSYYFSNALRSLNRAVLKLEGDAKKEAVKIRDESKKLAKKIKHGDKNLKDDLKKQTQKIKGFLEKHKTIVK